MNPEALPMQCLHQLRHWKRPAGNVLLAGAGDAQHTLKFMREDLDETRQHFKPVVENAFRALAAGEVEMTLHQAVNQFDISRLDYGFEINRRKVAAFFS